MASIVTKICDVKCIFLTLHYYFYAGMSFNPKAPGLFQSRRCPPLSKAAPLVYNSRSESIILSSELFLLSLLPKREFTNEADGVSLARHPAPYSPLVLIIPGHPQQG